MIKKGIILAGGSGSRLHPITMAVSKQLMPIYDKPMIYYPLSTLMLAGIRSILIITTPADQESFKNLLQDGSQWGIELQYAVQSDPTGLADAFRIGAPFIGDDGCCLILGDNIFFGHGLSDKLQSARHQTQGATIFGYWVRDPRQYGVAEIDSCGQVKNIEEKPPYPRSNYAVTGLYFYDNDVVQMAKTLKPSKRGELEITDINKLYLAENRLRLIPLARGYAWLDTGTPENLIQAGNFVSTLDVRQGLKIACPEEIAFRNKFINEEQLKNLAHKLRKSSYGKYLFNIAKQII